MLAHIQFLRAWVARLEKHSFVLHRLKFAFQKVYGGQMLPLTRTGTLWILAFQKFV
jgi:hypothetical protein